jgi:hypothetical protein
MNLVSLTAHVKEVLTLHAQEEQEGRVMTWRL